MTRSPLEVLLAFLRLGATSFGGPIAHLGYFRAEFVERRGWLDEAAFAECVAISQLLPGPSSSQTGILIGWIAAGPPGAAAAWAGFTAPSALLMTAIGLALPRLAIGDRLHGLLLVAAAVVASAVVTMRATLAPDPPRIALALGTFAAVLLAPAAWSGPLAIALCAGAGALLLHGKIASTPPAVDLRVSRRTGAVAFGAFLLVLVALGAAAAATHAPALVLANEFFRIGSLVFGGGHVVLPLMQSQLSSAGIANPQSILGGYAAAQAMPGPLFTIAAFAGAVAYGGALGWAGALLASLAIFAPSFFLLTAIAPFYASLASNGRFRSALAGANASVVGLLAAALVTPIASSSVRSWLDLLAVVVAFAALQVARAPAWLLVVIAAAVGIFVP
ncbi:MAG TPA: chromate efflux transporter [Verrucomicrobiae bacterium]|nr:chromate efflux transporter [Verrucomicrobiae bacterium]